MSKSDQMTSCEIVKRCIEFRDPPRIGLHFSVMPINGRIWDTSDFALVQYTADPNFVPQEPGLNEWGMKWETFDPTGENMGQVKHFPLAKGWEELNNYQFPDFSQMCRYAHLKEEVARHHAEGRYVYGSIPALMLLTIDMRGMENWFIDHAAEPDKICYLLDKIVDIQLQIIEQYHAAGVDGVITWDDMGTKDRPMLSPKMFREIYLPRYKRTTDALHERQMHFMHHCCGQVREYMDMFVEGGCDVLQLDQPELMGIDWLSDNYGGKICFWNCVDIQKTMPRGDFTLIEDEAHHQVWQLGKFRGGFMVKAYDQPNAIGLTEEQSEAQYQAFMKYAYYPLVPYPG